MLKIKLEISKEDGEAIVLEIANFFFDIWQKRKKLELKKYVEKNNKK